MTEPRKPCNVSRCPSKKKDGNESSLSDVTSALSDRDIVRLARALGGRRRELSWSTIMTLAWIFISFLVGLAVAGDALVGIGYAVYTLLFFMYAVLLSIVPVLGIFTLVGAGNVQVSLATSFRVDIANPWISFAVNGLYVVLGWIIQIFMLGILAFIIISFIAVTRD